MPKWELIDRQPLPETDGTLSLWHQDGHYSINVNKNELMTTLAHGSEEALAELAWDRVPPTTAPEMLVGGLGMGYTLAAALRRCPEHGSVTVAELMPAVVRWNRSHLGFAANYPLDDPRTIVYTGDVADIVADSTRRWSAILLDVDNGPMALTRPTNGWLYAKGGLAAAHAALVPGGVLAVWSAAPDSSFTRRLRKARFDVEMLRHTELALPTHDVEETHVIWFARRR